MPSEPRRLAANAAQETRTSRQSTGFMALYALAWAGGSISYVPFLTLLLPQRVEGLAPGAAVQWLGYITFAGAIIASVAHVVFGWLSDITRNRKGWIAAGLVLSILMLLTASAVNSPAALLLVLIGWQLALNMMLAPLSAWAGDCVPDGQKGLLGGMLALAPAAGALSGAIVTMPGLAGADGRLWIVAAMVAGSVLPVLLLGRPRTFPVLMTSVSRPLQPSGRPVRRMWLARFLIQITEAALFAYLLFYFRSIDPAMQDTDTARVFGSVVLAAVPLALLTGRWADRSGRPVLPLVLGAIGASAGLAIMAISGATQMAIVGYVVFGLSATTFLSLHAGQTLRVLPRPQTRGRDLGVFNLANTLPSFIMPWLTIGIVPRFGYGPLMWLLAGLALAAAALLSGMARRVAMPRLV